MIRFIIEMLPNVRWLVSKRVRPTSYIKINVIQVH